MTITPQIVRVIILLIGMLAVGIVIGRLTAPQVPTPLSPQHQVERTVSLFTELYHLSAPQSVQLRKIVSSMEEEMRPHLRGSVERRDIFRKYVPDYRALIPSEHEEAFARQVQAMERKFRRMIRRREMLEQ